jgi:hypothetical protein
MRKDVWAVTSVLGVALGFLAVPSSAAPAIGSAADAAKAAVAETTTLDLVRDGGGRGGGHVGGRGGGHMRGGHMSGHGGGHVRWHGGGSSYHYRRPDYSYSYGPRAYTSPCWYDASGVRICPGGSYAPRYYYGGHGHRYYYGGHGHRTHGYVSGGHRPSGHRSGGGGHHGGGGHRR